MNSLIDKLVVPGLTVYENDVLNMCLAQIQSHSASNTLRSRYYDSKATVLHMGISIPPQFKKAETVMGWPAKSVSALEHRINLDGFSTPDGGMEVLGLDRIYYDNRIRIEATQAHTSALKYGVGFLAVLAGGPGEPEVLIRNLSATSSTALWDANRRRASAALTVLAAEGGHPTEFILFLDYDVVTATFVQGRWVLKRAPHGLGRCPVAVLPFQPTVEKPLGQSRITRPVMTLTDHAIRTLLRMEVTAEIYTAPRSVILGADDSLFTDENGDPIPAWSMLMSEIMMIPQNEDPERETKLQTLPQMSMTPFSEQLRTIASMFAGEASIPVGQLGIIHDNPASDAAMHTAYLELDKTAERATDPFGAGWVDAMKMAVQIRDRRSEVPEELQMLEAKFRDPSTPTLSTTADAAMKLVSSGIVPADSDVVLERLGFSALDIKRIKSDRRRAAGSSLLAQLTQAATAAPQATADPAEAPVEAPEEA